MTLRADDGTILEAKQGSVLDQEGNTLVENVAPAGEEFFREQFTYRSQAAKVFQVSPWMAPLLAVGLVIALALGAVFLGGVLSLIFSVWLIRSILRTLGLTK